MDKIKSLIAENPEKVKVAGVAIGAVVGLTLIAVVVAKSDFEFPMDIDLENLETPPSE